MAITLPRIIGKDLTVTLTGGTFSQWEKISVDLPDNDLEQTAASSLFKQYVEGQVSQGKLTISGWLGSKDAATLPKSGDIVSAISIGVGSDGILPTDIATLAARGTWKVKNPKYDFDNDTTKYSFEIHSGFFPNAAQ